MIYAKIVVMCLTLFGFASWAWLGEVNSRSRPSVTEIKTRMPDVSPEVREKAFGLLGRVLVDAESLKTPEDRIRMRFLLADLLWEKDEPRARDLFASLAAAADKNGCFCISVNAIAARDAKLALSILAASPLGSVMDHSQVYGHFANQYPDEALKEAKKNVEGNNYLSYVPTRSHLPGDGPGNGVSGANDGKIGQLYQANKEFGANLARDILKKMSGTRFSVPTPYPSYNMANSYNISNFSNAVANFPVSNSVANRIGNFSAYANTPANYPFSLNANRPPDGPAIYAGDTKIPFAAAAGLLSLAVRSLDAAAKEGGPPILTAPEIKELAKTMITALTRAPRFQTYAVRPVYPHLKKYAPVETARLEKRLTLRQRRELNERGLDWSVADEDRSPYNQIPAPPGETQSEKEEREFVNDVRYHSQTYPYREQADADKFVRLKDPEKYPDLIEYFRDSLPTAYAKSGNLDKLRPYLANESNRLTRLTLLSLAAFALAGKNDKQGAARLIDEANDYLPSVLKKKDEFAAAESHALALARVAPGKGFALSEKLVDQASRLLTLSAELRDFTVGGENASSSFDVRRNQIAINSSHAIRIIRVLAHSDFERTVKLADRFSDPVQRVFFRWYITNALLNKNAEKEEATAREWGQH